MKQDLGRHFAINRETAGRVAALERTRPQHALLETEAREGWAIVQDATALSRGSFAQVELLAQGRPTGLYAYDCACPNAALARGDMVRWWRRGDGTIELAAGGGGGGTSVTNVGIFMPHGHTGPWDGSELSDNAFAGSA